MKYLILIALLFVSALLFLPRGAGTGIRNVPLLISILVVLAGLFVFSLLKSAMLKMRVKRSLRRSGFAITKRGKSLCRNRIFAEYHGTAYQILLMNRKRSSLRHHFESENTIEYYKTTAPVYKTNPITGDYAVGAKETSCAGKKKLRWLPDGTGEESKRFLVLDKLPGRITDSRKTRALGAGDTICDSDVCVYDYPAFITYLGTLKTADGSDEK